MLRGTHYVYRSREVKGPPVLVDAIRQRAVMGERVWEMLQVSRQWSRNFIDSLIAVLAGNAAYFLLLPHLPEAARHVPFKTDLGLLVDGWFCLVAFGLVKLARKGKQTSQSRRD